MRRYHIVLIVLALLLILFFVLGYIPARASLLYGPPAASLSIPERIEYSARLLKDGEVLTKPLNPGGAEQPFRIDSGEPVASVATRLEESSVIADAQAFYDYVVYTGLDTTLQAGDYKLSPALSIVDIARQLQDFSPGDATLIILSGWRMEEIAASLATSGLDISPEDFLAAAQRAPAVLDFVPRSSSMEGFFLPDSYTLPRTTTVDGMLDAVARNFTLHLTPELRSGFSTQGLDVYEAVTMASMVERESIHNEEMGLIASVFLNRLKIGMTLGSDATVQYALGYDLIRNTWWTNPLSLDNLKYYSPYNTYVYAGLPPGPIASPGLEAMQAVAFPQPSTYFYFQAKCDGSGFHTFAETFEEHLSNGCQ